jgi:predicted metal-dependent phosphoesterase TrpH
MVIYYLHIHTLYSWDGIHSVSAVLRYVVDHTDLDVIAITDHDEIAGAWEAVELAPAYGVEVIPGSEISTAEGHLLALFLKERLEPGLSLAETVLRVGEQGGLCIAAHPMARAVSSLSAESIRRALQVAGVDQILVGIEAFNAGLFHRKSNIAAWELAQSLPLAKTGNSDSHVLGTIGQGATAFAGKTAAELRAALVARDTQVRVSSRQSSGVRIASSWLPLYLLRSAGWVTWSPDPHQPLKLGRVSQATSAARAG